VPWRHTSRGKVDRSVGHGQGSQTKTIHSHGPTRRATPPTSGIGESFRQRGHAKSGAMAQGGDEGLRSRQRLSREHPSPGWTRAARRWPPRLARVSYRSKFRRAGRESRRLLLTQTRKAGREAQNCRRHSARSPPAENTHLLEFALLHLNGYCPGRLAVSRKA
jgi:hypothetical protein